MTVDYLTFNTKMNWLSEGGGFSRMIPKVRRWRNFLKDFQKILKNELDKDPRVVYNGETKQQ